MSAICPECDSPIDVDEYDVDIGDEMTCTECGSLLRVAMDSPVELELADEDEDAEDEKEDDDAVVVEEDAEEEDDDEDDKDDDE
ncbi:MAG: hypothetical protein Q7J25_01820 [Vicinamibacterales bacterium]|nr:hypothetical protein [Vicinamibacterales bacterium]